MAKQRGDIIEHTQSHDAEAGAYEEPQWLRERLEGFMDLRFGCFIHWGPYAQWNCAESWPLSPADAWARPDDLDCWVERGRDLERFSRDYWALNRTFDPRDFDPDAWAALARDAGMRYVAFTTKHHDGFCMFDTATTDYRVTHPDCPFHDHPRANVAREVFDAFRRRDMAVSCYFSKPDWRSPDFWSPDAPVVDRHINYDRAEHPERWARFVSYTHRQVEELMTGYGPIDALWLDGGWVRPPREDIDMAGMAAMARRHRPGLVMVDRTVAGPYENIITPEQKIPETPPARPWESCVTLGRAWKYVENDAYKSTREVVAMLVETAAKGGNLLLGIGPDARGAIPAEAEARLREIGRWLATNGEAIYATRPLAPHQSGRVRFTQKGANGYAIILAEESDGEANAAPRAIEIAGLRPAEGSEALLLGRDETVDWSPTDDGFHVELPDDLAADAPGWVLRFRLRV